MTTLPSWLTEQQRRAMRYAEGGHPKPLTVAVTLAALVRSLIEKGEEKDRAHEEAEAKVWELADLLRECRAYLPSESEILDAAASNESGQAGPGGVLVRKIERALSNQAALASLPDAKEPNKPCAVHTFCYKNECGCQPSGDERKEKP